MNSLGNAVESSPPEDAVDIGVSEARSRGRLILVAEDEPVNQKLILLQLGTLGYAAEVAANGIEAMRMWREGRYALLLTDLRMPEMDGYMLASYIRQEEGGRGRMPILALSASAYGDEEKNAREAGIDQYLLKPTDLKMLGKALEKWLPEAGNDGRSAPTLLADVAKAAPAVLDLGVLKDLVGDEPQTVQELLSEYRTAAFPQAGELKAAFAAGDALLVGAIAHKLKSSSRSIGARVLAELCAEMETAGREKDIAAIAQNMPRFEAAIAEVKAAIAGVLANHFHRAG